MIARKSVKMAFSSKDEYHWGELSRLNWVVSGKVASNLVPDVYSRIHMFSVHYWIGFIPRKNLPIHIPILVWQRQGSARFPFIASFWRCEHLILTCDYDWLWEEDSVSVLFRLRWARSSLWQSDMPEIAKLSLWRSQQIYSWISY